MDGGNKLHKKFVTLEPDVRLIQAYKMFTVNYMVIVKKYNC